MPRYRRNRENRTFMDNVRFVVFFAYRFKSPGIPFVVEPDRLVGRRGYFEVPQAVQRTQFAAFAFRRIQDIGRGASDECRPRQWKHYGRRSDHGEPRTSCGWSATVFPGSSALRAAGVLLLFVFYGMYVNANKYIVIIICKTGTRVTRTTAHRLTVKYYESWRRRLTGRMIILTYRKSFHVHCIRQWLPNYFFHFFFFSIQKLFSRPDPYGLKRVNGLFLLLDYYRV